jgi:hypothetical protein
MRLDRQRPCSTREQGLPRRSVFFVLLSIAACSGTGDPAADDEASGSDGWAAAPTPSSVATSATNPSAGNVGGTPPSAAASTEQANPAPAGLSAGATPSATGSPPSAAEPGASGGSASEPAADAPAGEMGSTLGFAKDVWPIFNSKCGPCHVTQHAGGHNVGNENVDAALADAVRREDDIIRALRSRAMPLRCTGANRGADYCVSDAELELIQAWFDEGSPP